MSPKVWAKRHVDTSVPLSCCPSIAWLLAVILKCSERVRLELQEEIVGRSKKRRVGGEGEGVTCHHSFSKIQFNACGVKQAKQA